MTFYWKGPVFLPRPFFFFYMFAPLYFVVYFKMCCGALFCYCNLLNSLNFMKGRTLSPCFVEHAVANPSSKFQSACSMLLFNLAFIFLVFTTTERDTINFGPFFHQDINWKVYFHFWTFATSTYLLIYQIICGASSFLQRTFESFTALSMFVGVLMM